MVECVGRKEMSREDTAKLLAMIQAVYPNFDVNDDKKTATINAWHWALEEYPVDAAMVSLKMYIKSNGTAFAPSVSQIIDGIYKPMEAETLTEGSAWALVKKAIQDGNYHAEERFNELPEIVQKAVGSANMIRVWAQTDSDEVNSVIMSNFQRNYRTVVHRDNEEKRIGSLMTGLAQAIAEKQEGKLIERNS